MDQEDLLIAIGSCIIATAPHSGEPVDVRAKKSVDLFRAIIRAIETPPDTAFFKSLTPIDVELEAKHAQALQELQQTRTDLAQARSTIADLTTQLTEKTIKVEEPSVEKPSGPRPPKGR